MTVYGAIGNRHMDDLTRAQAAKRMQRISGRDALLRPNAVWSTVWIYELEIHREKITFLFCQPFTLSLYQKKNKTFTWPHEFS